MSVILRFSFLCLCYSSVLSMICQPPNPKNIDAELEDAYGIAQNYYLWNNNLPTIADFDFNTYNTIPLLYSVGIRQFSGEKDKFSSAKSMEEWTQMNTGEKIDFGILLSKLNDNYYIGLVANNSPAQAMGLQRGMKLVFDNPGQADSIINDINNGVNGTVFNVLSSTIQTPVLVTYSRQSYKDTNVLSYDILSSDNHSVAYIHLSSFLIDGFSQEIDPIFASLKNQNISKLILDLRYNAEGYLNNMNYLLNHLVCDDFDNNISYNYMHNERLTSLNQTIRFEKQDNAVCMDEIHFIISESTAAASEILIHSLLPYIGNITVLGSGHSAGNFVGQYFFESLLGNYVLAPISFITHNALETETGLQGIVPKFMIDDDFTHNWGIKEALIKAALSLIDNPKQTINVIKESENKAILMNYSKHQLFIKKP